MSSVKDTRDKTINVALSVDDLEGVTGGVEMRTTKICPVCNQYRDDVEEED